jgi:adenosylcobinamide-GDP ribazoletransferase
VWLRPARIAVQFLTCVPVRLDPPPVGREVGLSLLWYPGVGLALGVLLWIAALLLRGVPAPLAAAILVALWVLPTGALHLDGLADTVDAWVGGRGDRERTLAIMKDPYSGPTGVTAIVCVLLLKFGALSALQASAAMSWDNLNLACAYILPPLLGRAAVPLLFAQTPYVRAQGLGADLAQYQSRAGGRWVAAITALVALVAGGRYGLLAMAVTAVTYLLMRRGFTRRLGGVTGDCVGAMIEAIEALSIAALASGVSA